MASRPCQRVVMAGVKGILVNMLVMLFDNIVFRVGQQAITIHHIMGIMLGQEVEAGLTRHGMIEDIHQVMASQVLMLVQVVVLATRLVVDIIMESLGLGQVSKLLEVVCSHHKYLLISLIGDPSPLVLGNMWVIRQLEV